MEKFRPFNADDPTEAFDRLFAQYSKPVYGYIFGQVGIREHAEDLLQQVFVRVWQHIDSAMEKGELEFRHWLFAVAKNLCIDFRRGKKHTEALTLDDLEVAADGANPEREAIAGDDMTRLNAAIESLPDDLRTVFTMTVLGELTSEEVAIMLGKPAGTVRYQVSEARKRLAKAMQI